MQLLDRLCGLETEYALRFHRSTPLGEPSRFVLFGSLIHAIGKRVLTVRAQHFKEGIFTANGGAVWFEAERPALGGGLVEGSTPECRSPRQLVTYQRAQDRLLADAAKSSRGTAQFRLIKNDRDAEGNVYGAQENYEVPLARGFDLFVWRLGLALLGPLLLLTWCGLVVMFFAMLGYLAVAGIAYLFLQAFHPQPQQLALTLFGQDLVEGRETGKPTPAWMESVLIWATRIVTGPLALAMLLLIHVAAFRKTRAAIVPFLISRASICGSGMVDQDGSFHLADKAPAMNCLIGYGGFCWDRPVFSMGHLLKALCGEGWQIPRNYCDLFQGKYRLQISLGDSNMCEASEYLRVGTTMLVLDAIERGYLDHGPRVRRPIRSLHRLCADPTLTATVTLTDGQHATALDLQRFYFQACQRMVDEHADASSEAHEIMHLWGEVIWALEERTDASDELTWLVGCVDWVTKKYLLDQAHTDASWEMRKKIDIRYHELSPEGYFSTLERTGVVRQIVEPIEVERAIRNAPPHTPATTRSHYIREFSQGAENFTVNWKAVRFSIDGVRKRVLLADYGRSSGGSSSQHANRTLLDDAESESL